MPTEIMGVKTQSVRIGLLGQLKIGDVGDEIKHRWDSMLHKRESRNQWRYVAGDDG